jgi:cellulose synthase/poly-beta-1,6-N-acetylglucosamine synthase-like glycosyltransferase
MVCGHSPYHPRQTFLQKILALDFFSLAAVSAAGIGIDMPLTCTGGNLAYRRRAYYAIGGFEKIASFVSGDDDLLLHEMHRHKPGKILYLTEPAAAVPTAPPASWRQFFWQRIRFASKGMHYKSRMTVGLVAAYVMNFLLAAGPLAAVVLGKWNLLGSLLALWSAKAVIELLFLQRAAQLFGENRLLRYFFIASILHPFYITVFGALGQFMSFRWKGERFQRTLATDPVTGAKR